MKNVFLLLFIAAYFFSCFATSDIQQLRIKESDSRKHNRVYKILGFTPLHLIFEGFHVNSLNCVIKNEISVFLPGKHVLVNYNNGTAVLQTPGLKGNLKTRFECAVKNRNITTFVQFYIKTTRDRILSAVDGKQLQFELRKRSEYEGIAEYICDEGEIVDLTCSKYLNYGSLKLRYYDQNGTKMVESDKVRSEDPLNFRLLVRAENDRSYVDCTHVTDESHNRREFTYRVLFIIGDVTPRNNVFIITINGMELISSGYQRLYKYGVFETIYTYHYKFIYSNTLNITYEKTDKSIVSDIITSLKPSPQIANLYKGAESIDFKQKRSLYNQYVQIYTVETKNLDEAIMSFNFIDFNENKYYDADIKFYMDDHDGPDILGLSQSNIIYQYNKSTTQWFIHYQYVAYEVLRLTCVSKKNSFLEWIYYGENIKSPILLNKTYGTTYISYDFYIDTETNETITCQTTSLRAGTRRITIVLHMIPNLPSSENENDFKVNSQTEIPITMPERQSNALQIIIIGITVFFLLAFMCAFCCWRLKKRAQVTKEKQLSRSVGEDYNRVNELTDQTESPEYECIESHDNAHPDALNANQDSSTPNRAPAPPPRSALPSKNTRFQISPRGGISHREMEQCRCFTNQRSGLECAHIENEYDYVYGVKKKCRCVASSNRNARKPLRRDGGAFVPHRVPAHQ